MKPGEISDFHGLHYDVNTWEDYKWVQFAKQYPSGGWTPWTWTTVDELAKFRKQHKSTLIFHTIGHFIKPDKESLQLSNLCQECDVGGETDFERKQNFRRMQNTMDELYRFYADLGIEDGQIRFFFTGGRSIYPDIMYQVFEIEPMVELNQVMKHIGKYFNDGLLYGDEYYPLDLNIYKNPNMLRMPNSYYPEYDAWKIELSPREINLPEAELRQLAKEPRPPLYDLSDIPIDPIPDALEWYRERVQEFEELQKEREHISVKPKALKELEGIPACIADLRENTIREDDTRNRATMLDATFCKSTGVSKNDAFAIINEWVQRIPDTLTDRKRGKAREAATKSVVESVYRGKKYKFACGYAQALDLECSQEACPLYKKKAFQRWNKRVKVIPDFTPTYKAVMISIDELRMALSDKVGGNGCDLLLHAPPGSGKTQTTLVTVDSQEKNILYSPPRREMLDHPMSLITHSPRELIKPRGPIGEKPEHPDDMILWEATAPCKHYKQAEALATKRWNVVKTLCSKRCDIGMARCTYWKQFKVFGSSLVTHHYLPIPYQMKSLIADNNPTIVFDEPTPIGFIEQVNITTAVLTEEIERHKTPDIIKFLELIRTVIENHEGGYTTGKAIIQRMVQTNGDFDKLLDAILAWLSVTDDYVEIKVDNILAQSTERAWLVNIDGKEHWIARRLCFESDISAKKVMIPFWLADRIGADYIITESENKTDSEESEGEIPLNFLAELATVLYDEIRKYKQGKNYNSQLALTKTSLKRKVLRLNLRKHLALSNCRLICLDAYGDAELLSQLTNRPLTAWTLPIAIDAEVIQITDGYYGITTMWRKKAQAEGGGIPKKALKRLIDASRKIVASDPEGTLIITWKLIHQHIEKLQAEGKFDNRVALDHFGNIKGTNKHEHKRQVIIIGAPSIQEVELLQMANCIWHDDEKVLDDEMIKDGNWRPYQYREAETGNGYAVEVREHKDPRLNLLLKTYREYEIAQAAHRIRPLLYPGERKIWLLTNLPIDELPPTKLTTLNEIIAETDPMFLAFKSEVAKIQSEYSGVWMDCMKIRIRTRVIDNNTIYNDAKAKNPSIRTLERWFNKATELLNYESTIVTIGGNVRLKVYHDGNLNIDKIRKLYHELQEAKNESKREA